MNEPRKQHLTPRFYLEGFTLPKSSSQLFVLDSKRDKSFPANIKDLTTDRDFYRVDNAQGGDPFVVEKFLSLVEDRVKPTLQAISTTGRMPEGEAMEDLMYFIASLWARARVFRSRIDELTGDVVKLVSRRLVSNPETWERAGLVAGKTAEEAAAPPDFDAMQAFIRSNKLKVTIDRGWLVKAMLETTSAVVEPLMHRKWIVHVAEDQANGPWFLTTNEPVGLHWIKRVDGPYGIGFALTNTVVTFPVTKSCFIEGYLPPDLDLKDHATLRANAQSIAWYNSRIVRHLGDQVFAPNDSIQWIGRDDRIQGTKELRQYLRAQWLKANATG